MKTECQSCFTDVIPMEDGLCPSCGQSVAGANSRPLTKVTVRWNDSPAGMCMKCGAPTQQHLRVRKKCRNSNFQPAAGSINQHPLAVLLDFVAGKYHQAVEVTVPLCSSCRKAGDTEPKYIDFEAKSMTFVGHKAWQAEVLRLRAEAENAKQL